MKYFKSSNLHKNMLKNKTYTIEVFFTILLNNTSQDFQLNTQQKTL